MAYKVKLYRRLIVKGLDINGAGLVELSGAEALSEDPRAPKSLRATHAVLRISPKGLELRGLVCDPERDDGGEDEPNARGPHGGA
jgi:hypothetical protein